MKKKIILAFLLLCSTAAADGPLFSIWHIDGHGYAWQQAQIDAGLPIEPTIRIPSHFENEINSPQTVTRLNSAAALLANLNGRPVVLRMNNVTSELGYATPRLNPLTEATASQAYLSVRRLTDGTLDQTPTPSPWAGSEAWSEYGAKLANSAWMKRVQEIVPSPSSVILRENNEGPRHKFATFYLEQRVRWVRTDNNTLQFATPTTPRDRWVNDNREPLGSEWIGVTVNSENVTAYRWKTQAELDAIDIRSEAWVAPKRGTLPTLYESDFWALYRAKYEAMFAGFRDNLSPAWKAVWKGCCGYGADPYHDADSPAAYTNYYADRPASLCSPLWAKYRDKIVASQASKAWREISIRMNGQTMYQSVLDGTGDFVDADSYACFNVHWAWSLQSAGKQVRLVWWDNYNTPPNLVIPASATYRDTLTQLGRADLTTLTLEQCEVAVMQRMKQIHSNPILSRYWRDGTTRVLTSSLNTSAVTKVYATETTIPDDTRTLVCVYSPSVLTGEIDVGPHRVPAKRFGYWIVTKPVQEIQ